MTLVTDYDTYYAYKHAAKAANEIPVEWPTWVAMRVEKLITDNARLTERIAALEHAQQQAEGDHR